MASILRQGIALTAARYLEQGTMLLTPIVLVRTIGPTAFGEYRLFWLLVSTVALLFSFDLPRSLLFFFVRLDLEGRRVYVGQTTLLLFGIAIVAAVLIFAFGNFLPSGMRDILHRHGYLFALFLPVWIVGLLLDILPNAAGRIRWQAQAVLATAVLRAMLIVVVAVFFHRLEEVLIALLIAACMRLGLLAYFIACHCGIRLFPLSKAQLRQQLQYAIPFGVATLLFHLRKQAEQWIVAAVFPSAMFGVFSIAATLVMPLEVLRGGLANLLLPKMSHLHSLGSHRELLRLNNQANVIISVVIFPAVAALFVFANEIIQFLFTREYVSGSPVLRIYLVQTLIQSVEINALLYVFEQGPSNMRCEASMFPFAVLFSLVGVWYYGLPGAAIGSVLAGLMVHALFLKRLSKIMRIPIARLQDWKSLGIIWSISVVCALAVRLSADLLKPPTAVAAIGGPAAVLVLYVIMLFATGYYRNIAELRREWGSLRLA